MFNNKKGNTVALDPDTVQTTAGISGVIAAFLLRHLHGKINEAANKADLAAALHAVATQRLEDMERSEQYRRERRETEEKIFNRLNIQDAILARIDERTAKLTGNNHG